MFDEHVCGRSAVTNKSACLWGGTQCQRSARSQVFTLAAIGAGKICHLTGGMLLRKIYYVDK